MKDWEFLIQKEGETWQPVPSSLEIEAGKYRLAAHTQPNLELEVSVSYRGEGRISYSRKQQRCTNEKGLVALMSWTDLKPGHWQFNCCGDIISELLGEGWHKGLQLQVMPATEAAAEIPAEPAATISEPETAAIEPIWEEVTFDDREEPAPETALPIALLEDIVVPQPEVALPSPEAEAAELTEIELRLTLYEDTFVKRVGEPILISGQIEVSSSDQENDWELVQGTLRYLLRDPQTTQILLNLEQQISEQSLPLIFSSSLEIPFEASLLLGEVILEVPAEDENEQLVPVARQAFAVTANLEELLESFLEEGDRASADAEGTAPVALRRISLFDPRTSSTNQMRSRSSDHQVLPPKISAAATTKTEIKLPQLPKVPASILSSKDFESALKRDRSAVDEAFDALKLEERFWSRLSALKIELEESDTASVSEFSADDDER